MFTAIVRFSIKKKLFVGLTTLFLFIGGIYAMLTLPIDAVTSDFGFFSKALNTRHPLML